MVPRIHNKLDTPLYNLEDDNVATTMTVTRQTEIYILNLMHFCQGN